MDVKSMYYRYFMYSREQEQRRQDLLGNTAEFGNVMVRGVPKRYTCLVSDPDKAPADAVVVWKGDLRKAKYTTVKAISEKSSK